MTEKDPASYSLQILLPKDIDGWLRNWCQSTPGATWPAWGGHVTMLPAFHPVAPIECIEEAAAEVISGFAPFELALDHVWCRPHLIRPAMCIVFLTTHHRRPAELWGLHRRLVEAISPMALPEWEHLWRGQFRPHVSLTTGLSSDDADRLLESTIKANVRISFVVDRIFLMRHPESTPEAVRVASFSLPTPRGPAAAAMIGKMGCPHHSHSPRH